MLGTFVWEATCPTHEAFALTHHPRCSLFCFHATLDPSGLFGSMSAAVLHTASKLTTDSRPTSMLGKSATARTRFRKHPPSQIRRHCIPKA
jgi:hypothetical protein